jgi:hypothetical protein
MAILVVMLGTLRTSSAVCDPHNLLEIPACKYSRPTHSTNRGANTDVTRLTDDGLAGQSRLLALALDEIYFLS